MINAPPIPNLSNYIMPEAILSSQTHSAGRDV
jgi:hypothetical protein